MTMTSLRLLKMLVLAMLLGLLFGVLRARAAVVQPYPDPCRYLEPYSYWWYFLYCDQRESESESFVIESVSDEYDAMTVRRRSSDGTVRELHIFVPKKGR